MTPEIRDAVKHRIAELSRPQADIAREIGVDRQYLYRMLNQEVGEPPESWQKLLDVLNLELVVKPRGDANP